MSQKRHFNAFNLDFFEKVIEESSKMKIVISGKRHEIYH